MAHYAKPGNEPAFHAEYNGSTKVWEVIAPKGMAVETTFATRSAAVAYAAHRNKEVAEAFGRKERSCMCCKSSFQSEGIHNRLCPRCRNAGSETRPMSFINPARRYG